MNIIYVCIYIFLYKKILHCGTFKVIREIFGYKLYYICICMHIIYV